MSSSPSEFDGEAMEDWGDREDDEEEAGPLGPLAEDAEEDSRINEQRLGCVVAII